MPSPALVAVRDFQGGESAGRLLKGQFSDLGLFNQQGHQVELTPRCQARSRIELKPVQKFRGSDVELASAPGRIFFDAMDHQALFGLIGQEGQQGASLIVISKALLLLEHAS